VWRGRPRPRLPEVKNQTAQVKIVISTGVGAQATRSGETCCFLSPLHLHSIQGVARSSTAAKETLPLDPAQTRQRLHYPSRPLRHFIVTQRSLP
jgi:hypothetical protein